MKRSEQRSFPILKPFRQHNWLVLFWGMAIAWGCLIIFLVCLALEIWTPLARWFWLGAGLSGAIALVCAMGLKRAVGYQSQLEAQLQARIQALTEALRSLQHDHLDRFQTEKMAGLNQMVAGLAHELNNPINFIEGNLPLAQGYIQDLLLLVVLYQQALPHPGERIEEHLNAIELDFLQADLPKILASMRIGTQRVQQIVKALRTFARLDESALKTVDVHAGLDSTVFFLLHRLRQSDQRPFRIMLTKRYGSIPPVECYASQLNQVFLSVLTNAIDAIEAYHPHAPEDYQPQVTIKTEQPNPQQVTITITDNGGGIPEMVRDRLFDPFFTTKPVGQGTGLGLAISHQIIVEQHRGKLTCYATPHPGTTFRVEIPLTQTPLPRR